METLRLEEIAMVSGGTPSTSEMAQVGAALGGAAGVSYAMSAGAAGSAVVGMAAIGAAVGAGVFASFGVGYAIGTLIYQKFVKPK